MLDRRGGARVPTDRCVLPVGGQRPGLGPDLNLGLDPGLDLSTLSRNYEGKNEIADFITEDSLLIELISNETHF